MTGEPENPDVRPEWAPLTVDLDRPSAARVWDYYLGGSHNFQVDRALARQAMERMPDAPLIARATRAFLHRSVRFLTAAGIDQFIDVGSGIPTVAPVHEVARETLPGARVVYADNDPVAVTHSRALLHTDPETLVLEADLRRPDELFGPDGAAGHLDFTRPVAVLLIAVLHFIPDSDDPAAILANIRARLAPGSYLVIVHGSAATEVHQETADLYRRTPNPITLRPYDEILRFFDGFDLVPPGLVPPTSWRPELSPPGTRLAIHSPGFAGVGRL
ncbi:SAM-dependent methyltransferase [Nocardia sp. CDC153]|uniref:SAM-dependent methyltransferase n=1 Tax=Nocardia sp. CDC153 TaxID=3112167 RepID=UPI002DB6BAE6|nr:SAM-dependent methyltransferase [Nocardia sp. CDC153]MEC3957039.1 SAM-dependent methyltransferase [Nocardia sp. CDC153]